ncbi:MAG TPA: amino acid permease [Vicinamibacterales bacterium]|nr:amino acid permease [Vicinamibacterales bacterium]
MVGSVRNVTQPFKRALGPFDATMIVIGGIIGSGIFINPYIVAQRLDSSALVIGAWVAGAAIAVIGALAYAELGAMLPAAGGQYVYLREAYHPLVAFLYGWALLFMIESGAMAAVAMTFAEYAVRLVTDTPQASARVGMAGVRAIAVGAIVFLSVINYLGVIPGSRLLNVFVVLKVAALAVLIAGGLLFSGALAIVDAPAPAAAGSLTAFGAALIPIVFAYGGWQNANYVAEEIKDPKRILPVCLLAGTAIVAFVYITINFAYLKALGLGGLAATTTPASDAARLLFGATGDRFVTAAIAISTFGFLNLCVLAPTRVYYAMAADRAFFPQVARLHPRYQTPSLAIVLQSTWAIALTLTGTYGTLLDYVVFADWIFFGLTVASVFVFRRTMPEASRPFRMWGYPLTPAVFVVAAVAIVVSVVRVSPLQSAIGAALMAAGIPAFLYWNRQR